MKKFLSVCVLLSLLLYWAFYLIQDNATSLGHSLRFGAWHLNWLGGTETVVNYQPRTGITGPYSIEIRAYDGPTTPRAPGSGLYVNDHYETGKDTQRGATTSLHQTSVHVPKRLFIVKTNAAAQVVLRKNGDRIEVVELR